MTILKLKTITKSKTDQHKEEFINQDNGNDNDEDNDTDYYQVDDDMKRLSGYRLLLYIGQ